MSTYTSSIGLEQITPGDQAGLWGNTTNNNLALIDQAVTGVTPISFAALSGSTYTLTDYNGAVDEARSAVLNITGNATGSNTVVVPNKQKTYLVRNNTGRNVVCRTASPTASYTVEAGNSILIFCDGNNSVFTGIASPSVGTLSVSAGGTGSTTFTAGFVKSPGGTGALTSSSAVSLTADVSGTLPVTSGGTGAGTFTSGSLLVGNGTSNFGTLAGSANGQVATWNGSTWTAAASASAGVTSFNSRTGVVTLSSADVTTALGYTPASLSGTNNFTGTNNYSSAASIQMTGSNTGDQRIGVTGGGASSGLASSALQLYSGGVGLIYLTSGSWDNSAGIGMIMSGGAGNLQITSTSTLYTGAINAYKTGSSTSWIIASDSRIKKNVTPYTKGLAELNQIQIKNFEYNGLAGSKDGEKAVGVIADEIQQVLPDTVKTNNIKLRPDDAERTSVKHFDNTELIYLLVNSVKELKAELDTAKAEIAALKAK